MQLYIIGSIFIVLHNNVKKLSITLEIVLFWSACCIRACIQVQLVRQDSRVMTGFDSKNLQKHVPMSPYQSLSVLLLFCSWVYYIVQVFVRDGILNYYTK